ncbi:MAG: restriction endonuclease subunit S [Leptospiraceae bacterium]|nr:restriction endonuclease subunit S [Leptospiraceae bacterium]MCP5496290.1 restriction endonuclease subunit S [Leptospiraceae bacterium]
MNEGWRKVRLGDVCESIQAGLIRKANEVNIVEANIPYIKMDCLGNSSNLILRNIVYISASKEEIKKYNLKDKDILFNVRNSLELVGKVAIFKSEYPIALYNHMLVRLRLNQLIISPHFLIQYFISGEFKREIELIKKGTTSVAAIYQGDIEKLQIPLPPLEEQKRIANDLDYRLNEVEKAKQATLEQLEAADALWKAYLQEAFQDNEKWEKVKLGDVLLFIGSGVTPLGGHSVYSNDGILFIRSQNVLWGKNDFSDAVFLPQETHKNMQRSVVLKNDVLLNITGASIGRCSIYDNNEEANVNQHVTILRTNKNKLYELFLMYCIISPIIQQQITDCQAGGTRQALNFLQIKNFQIPLPPLEEQKRIANYLQEKLAQVETLKQKLKEQLGVVEVLPQAYLREVFGEDKKD